MNPQDIAKQYNKLYNTWKADEKEIERLREVVRRQRIDIEILENKLRKEKEINDSMHKIIANKTRRDCSKIEELCSDFLKGICDRRVCKFTHVNPSDYSCFTCKILFTTRDSAISHKEKIHKSDADKTHESSADKARESSADKTRESSADKIRDSSADKIRDSSTDKKRKTSSK